jgi:oxysterol-binding protein 1
VSASFVLTWIVSVDAAAAEVDPLRRIAFVAAFAMSNYSSTIGRIAKPFNPMLVGII